MLSSEELKNRLLTACRILEHEGILDELGHFSVKVGPGRVLMNGKISPGQAGPEDLVLLDLDGNQLEGRLEPAKEIPLHLAVFKKRPEITAIAHTHSPTIVALSAAGVALQPLENLGATVFGEQAPLFEEYGLVDSFEMGFRVVEAMGSNATVVLKGHGNLVTGSSIEECCISAIWMEKAARLQVQAMQLGKPHWYPSAEIKKIRGQIAEGKAFKRAWDYYVWRLDKSQREKENP